MTEKHTAEPWSFQIGSEENPPSLILAGQQFIAQTVHGNDEANARRIVACVNACQGIPTEALEAGVIERMPLIIKGLLADPNSIVRHAAHDILAKLKGRG